MAADYQALGDQHAEEMAQILEEYGAAELEITRQLQENEVERLVIKGQTIDIVERSDKPQEEAESKP